MDSIPRLLILEDDPEQREHLALTLKEAGYDIAGAHARGEDALWAADRDAADLVLADALLEGEMGGAEAARLIRRRSDLPVIFLTGNGEREHLLTLRKERPAAILIKPWKTEELLATIELALEKHRQERARQAAQQETMDSLARGNVRAAMLTDALTRLLKESLGEDWRLETFVPGLLDELRALTDSRYAAFAALDQDGHMETFVARGIDPETQAKIGHPPRGEGLLGALYRRGYALRVEDAARHPQTAGLPPHHPPLGPLLGMPVRDGERLAGTIYLAREPGDPPYRETDSELVRLFAVQMGHLLARARLHRHLRQTHDRLHALLADSPVVLFQLELADPPVVSYLSDNARRILGSPREVLTTGNGWLERIHPDDRSRIRALLEDARANGQLVTRCRFQGDDGQARWIEIRAHQPQGGPTTRLVGVIQDISEEKRVRDALERSHDKLKSAYRELREAQEQALQSEKLASIGQLAAGVAHEINNPVGYIGSNLGSLEQDLGDLFALLDAYREATADLPDGHPRKTAVQELEARLDLAYLRADLPQLIRESREGVERVRTIVQDLKDFSRAGDGRFVQTDLHQGLESTLNIVHNQLKYKAEVIKDYDPHLPEVVCIPSQINQVLMNLLVNAAQAIDGQGTITLRTRHDEETVTIEVADTGCGIPPEVQRRIFDPFFTTKPQGQGTGLGLSLSYGIVQRHGGRLEVDSEPGQGTTFRLILPRRGPQTTLEASA